MSQSLSRSEGEIAENGHESDSGKGREASRHTSRRSRSDSNGSPHITDSSISLYKTEPCQSFSETGYCRYGLKCRFAHGQADIRPLARHKKYKTELCKTYAKSGFCPYGARCRFVHEESERETSRTASPAPGVDLSQIKENNKGVNGSPFVAPTTAASPALSPYVPAAAASPMLPAPAALPIAVSPAPRKEAVHIESSPSAMPVLPPPPQRGENTTVIHSHAPIRRPNSPALTPIGTPVNKPVAPDMKPFDAFQSLSLSTGPDDSRLRPYGARTTFSLRSTDLGDVSSSLFSDFGGGLAPLGPRSLSVPADHRTSSGPSAHVGGLRASPPLRPPDLVRGLSLSVGHHPLEQPRVDPPSLAIPPSSILDSMTIKPLPLNTSSAGDSKDDYYLHNRPTPRSAATRSRSFDISESYRSFSQEEELASCSSILSHLELHSDSQPLSPSTVEPQEALFKQLPPLYPKRQSFCYDDIAMLPTSSNEGRYDPRPKTPDIKQAANMNTIIATPPKGSPPYKPHSSPLHQSPLKLAQTPPPHGRTSRARVSVSSSPGQHGAIHHFDIEGQLAGQFESLGRSKTDPRAPPAKKDVRLSAFAAPFSTAPASPASAPSVSARIAPMNFPSRSLFTSTSTSTSSSHVTHSPLVMHLTPDSSYDAEPESTVLSLLSSDSSARTSPSLSPFPPPFFPKSPQKESQQKRGSLRKLE